jgi:hypothetical protein
MRNRPPPLLLATVWLVTWAIGLALLVTNPPAPIVRPGASCCITAVSAP